tara:strand:- start:7970 stop:8797 length:828 start_codon:yes stop_codon:yes gene_type:complete
MGKPTLYRAWIKNKKVVHRTYWGGSDDAETKAVLNEIKGKFPKETYAFPIVVWGVKMDGNKYSVHTCSCEPDYKDSDKFENSILLSKDFIKYFYDMDTSQKYMEVVYKKGQVLPTVSVPSNLTVAYITDKVNAKYEPQNEQAIYVTGAVADVYAWADSLKKGIEKPISVDKALAHTDDCFKFQFDSDKALTEIILCTHLERYQVYGYDDDLYIEYTAPFADELTNLADTEIVIPNTDNHGNRIAQNVNKKDIKEFIKVPKDDGSGGYDIVPLKDL